MTDQIRKEKIDLTEGTLPPSRPVKPISVPEPETNYFELHANQTGKGDAKENQNEDSK